MPIPIDPHTLLVLARGDRELAHRLRGLSATIRLPFVDPPLDILIDDGMVMTVAPAGRIARLSFEGPAEFWEGAFAKVPRPGFESLTAGMICGVHVAGASDIEAASYHGGFARLVEVIRASINKAEADPAPQAEPFRDTDSAIGRYVHVRANDTEARMFYEESGDGDVVLLMQHTAGGDARQYRHLLADPEMQRRCRLIAYDLPCHGRSLPPIGVRWWEENYSTSKGELMNWVVGLADALALDRPIFMGCSVGGNLALDLAAHHAHKFRGFIAVNGWYAVVTPDGFSNDPFRDPRLSADRYAALCLGATSPTAPESFRQEVYWNYCSNAPGIYAGDNDYFLHGHDLRVDGHLIDAGKTPVYVLVGEYDPSARNEEFGGPAVARNIPGIVYREMKGLSHFAPTDDPLGFRQELAPALDAIMSNSSTRIQPR